jgi:membrane protein DedA with SNARE-associated domain
MVNISMKQRIGNVLSLVWLLVAMGFGAEKARHGGDFIGPFIGIGVIPLVVGWGVWWIWKGRTKTKPGKND